MQIKTSVYESLPPLQRVSATLKALDRNDEREVQRLTETCPLKTYRQRDAEFSDRIEAFFILSMAVENDLTALALSYFAPNVSEQNKNFLLQSMSNLQNGWMSVVDDFGVGTACISKIGPPRHSLVALLLQYCPSFQPAETALIRKELKGYLFT